MPESHGEEPTLPKEGQTAEAEGEQEGYYYEDILGGGFGNPNRRPLMRPSAKSGEGKTDKSEEKDSKKQAGESIHDIDILRGKRP